VTDETGAKNSAARGLQVLAESRKAGRCHGGHVLQRTSWIATRMLALAALSVVCSTVGAPGAWACSTFVLESESVLLVGHNLDETPGFHVPGLICVNKRGVQKKSISWADLVARPTEDEPRVPPEPRHSWVSVHGSITVNTDGLEFPDGGLNEAGLVIWEMSMSSTRFSTDEGEPTIFMSQWMQYQLDSFSTVGEVIDSARSMNLDGWNWHFFVADASGASAVIEFIDGEAVTYTGEDMPVPVLCNSPYAAELARLEEYQAPGFKGTMKRMFSRPPRFVRAARLLEDYDESVGPAPLDHAWAILENVRIRGWNKWSILVDVTAARLYFNTEGNREIRFVSMEEMDFSCEMPARMMDIYSDLSGDVSGHLDEYTFEENAEFVRGRADLLFVERLLPVTENGVSAAVYARRFAEYPESTRCQGGE
jgi:penicillin V acylase-like amidase (Ntn superfamily)